MEHLEKLKNVWKNQGESSIKFTKDDIYKMVHQRSSSVVKWILIISILEFILPNLFIFFSDLKSTNEVYQSYGLSNIMLFYTILHVVIIIGFIYYFYKNYKNISADSSVKNLLSDILKTRSTVKYYIYYNITIAAVIGLHVFFIVFNSDVFLSKIPENTNMIIIWVVAIILLAIVLFLFWLFYRILYGFLLKKLKQNYKELNNNI